MAKYRVTSECTIILTDPNDRIRGLDFDLFADAKAAALLMLRGERDALNDRIYDVVQLRRSDIRSYPIAPGRSGRRSAWR
jgi:hypothetical protein